METKELKFSVVLKTVPVILTDKDDVENEFSIRELTGEGREIYNDSMDYTMEVDNDEKVKVIPGKDFKVMSAKDFLALCFYDKSGELVPVETIGKYPSTVLSVLHESALKLSGMDLETVQAKLSAKNVSSEVSD